MLVLLEQPPTHPPIVLQVMSPSGATDAATPALGWIRLPVDGYDLGAGPTPTATWTFDCMLAPDVAWYTRTDVGGLPAHVPAKLAETGSRPALLSIPPRYDPVALQAERFGPRADPPATAG